MKPYTRIAKWIMALCLFAGGAQTVSGEEIRIDVSLDPAELVIQQDPTSLDDKIYIEWVGMVNDMSIGHYDLPVFVTDVSIPLNAYDISVDITNPVMEETSISPERLGRVEVEEIISEGVNVFETCTHTNQGDEYEYYPYPIVFNDCITPDFNRKISIGVSPFHIYNAKVNLRPAFSLCLTYKIGDKIGGSYPLDNEAAKNILKQKAATSSQVPEYIIITTEKLKAACQSLAIWKAQKGLSVELRTIEEICNMQFSKVPVDKAQALRFYLRTLHNSKIDQYCFLIGPSDEIPYRYFYYEGDIEGDSDNLLDNRFIPTDTYYSDLFTDFKLNMDVEDVYTAPIRHPFYYSACMNVGRLICNNETEFWRYFKKLMIYESYPGKGNTDYLSNGLVIKQAPMRIHSDLSTELGTLDNVIICKDADTNNFETNTPTGETVILKMRNAGIIDLQGHGSPSTIACAGFNKDTGNWRYIKAKEAFEQSEVKFHQTENNAGLDKLCNPWSPSVIYTLSCSTMPYDNLYSYNLPWTMGTSYTVGGMYGGVAFIGNTRPSYGVQFVSTEKKFAQYILSGYKIGHALSFAKSDYLGTITTTNLRGYYVHLSNNLLGDPEIQLWRNAPDENNNTVRFNDNDEFKARIYDNDVTLTLYDGLKMVKTKGIYDDTTINTSALATPGMFVASVWEDQTLPIIDFHGRYGECRNQKNSFLVKRAFLGNSENDSFNVSENGQLSVLSLCTSQIGNGFRINKNGTVILKSYGTITAQGGTVATGGSLIMTAESVTLENGFCVEQGGELQIEATSLYTSDKY